MDVRRSRSSAPNLLAADSNDFRDAQRLTRGNGILPTLRPTYRTTCATRSSHFRRILNYQHP